MEDSGQMQRARRKNHHILIEASQSTVVSSDVITCNCCGFISAFKLYTAVIVPAKALAEEIIRPR